jgi:hypothetical protein
VYEVQQGKTQQLAIGPDNQICGRDFNELALFLSQYEERLSNFTHEPCQVDLLKRRRESARICPGKQK